MTKPPKRIGLVGGLSPESTVEYYETICRAYNRRFGGLHFPELTIQSINLQRLSPLFESDDWEGVAVILLDAIERLHRAGAEFAAILANTPHHAYELIRDKSPLPIVTIMDATSAALVRDGRRKVALLGTRPTMEYGFFQKHFAARGIDTLVPGADARREIDRVIWQELSHGVVSEPSKEAMIAAIDELAARGADAVVLACTELPMLIETADVPWALYDTTQLHAEAILEYALQPST